MGGSQKFQFPYIRKKSFHMNVRQEIEKELDRIQNPLDLERLLVLIKGFESQTNLEPISESMKKRIQRGEEQIRNGNTKTKAQVDERFDQWLRSK